MHHPHLEAVALHDDVDRLDVLVGVSLDQLADIHSDDFLGNLFSSNVDFHVIISLIYSNSCFISYNYIVAEKMRKNQLQVTNFHISLLIVNSFLNKKRITL